MSRWRVKWTIVKGLFNVSSVGHIIVSFGYVYPNLAITRTMTWASDLSIIRFRVL